MKQLKNDVIKYVDNENVGYTPEQRHELLKYIANHHGLDNQLEMMVEECSEVIHEIQKYKRVKIKNDPEAIQDRIEKMKNKIADINNITNQLMLLLNFESKELYKRMDLKIRRGVYRINNDSKKSKTY